jgi:hypothetical protein
MDLDSRVEAGKYFLCRATIIIWFLALQVILLQLFHSVVTPGKKPRPTGKQLGMVTVAPRALVGRSQLQYIALN